MGMSSQILELLKCICRESTSCVRVNECLTRPFEVTVSLCQGCVLSFQMHMEIYIVGWFGEMAQSSLLYAC